MTNQSMSLPLALNHISHVFHILTPADVFPFVALDPHGGYHAGYEDGFTMGSMWRVEGQVVYALARALKPLNVLELGTSRGCSATHVLQALHDNKRGHLDCVDNGSQVSVIGDLIPDDLRANVTINRAGMEDFVPGLLDGSYDMIIEDGNHLPEQVAFVWGQANRLLRAGGIIVSHDAMHATAGPAVREGIARAGYADTMGYGNGVMYVLIEPSDCGLAIWRKGA